MKKKPSLMKIFLIAVGSMLLFNICFILVSKIIKIPPNWTIMYFIDFFVIFFIAIDIAQSIYPPTH